MKIHAWLLCGMFLTPSWILEGQQSKLSGPVAGFVFDGPARVLRPIQGVPGASLLGDPVNFGFELAAVYVSPHQDSALVVGADQSLHLFRLNGGAVAEISLGGVAGVPQSVVFSPSGTAAALFALGKVRVLSGLPSAATLVGTVTVPGSGQAPPPRVIGERARPARAPGETLALSDDGSYLLAVSGGAVRLLSIRGENRNLLTAQRDALVAFAPGGHDAAVMDSVGGLTLLRDVTGTAIPQLLAAPDAGLGAPAGLAFSQDRLTLYVASGSARSVAAFNLAAGTRTTIGCDCSPAALVPMGNLFRLNELGAEPLWLLDGAGSNPRIVFVPARGE